MIWNKRLLSLIPRKPTYRPDDNFETNTRIESRPTPLIPIVVGGSVSGLIIVAFSASALIQVDQLVSATGKLEPLRSTQEIKAPESGVVIEVLVREGQQVQQGQKLVLLDPRILKGKELALSNQQQELTVINRQELVRVQSAIGESRSARVGLLQNRQILAEQVSELQRLESEGAASRFQLLDYQKQLADIDARIRANRLEQNRLLAESSQKQAEIKARRAENIAAQIETNTRLKRVTLRAPVKGTVLNLKAKTGAVVSAAGDTLLQLVPSENLQGKIFVANKDLAFVKLGQSADIAIEAYDRNRYGSIKGTVATIGTDSLPADNQYDFPRFPITLKLHDQALQRDGKRLSLQAGMAITADLQLGRRSLLELFFSNITNSSRSLQEMR